MRRRSTWQIRLRGRMHAEYVPKSASPVTLRLAGALLRCLIVRRRSNRFSFGPAPEHPGYDRSTVQQRSTATGAENGGLRRTSMDDQSELEQSFQTLVRCVFKMACKRSGVALARSPVMSKDIGMILNLIGFGVVSVWLGVGVQ